MSEKFARRLIIQTTCSCERINWTFRYCYCAVYGFAIFVVVTNALFDLESSDKSISGFETTSLSIFGKKYDLNASM